MSAQVQIARQHRPYKKAASANVNSSAFPSRIPTITEPTGGAVVDIAKDFLWVPQEMMVLPYGLGNNDDVFDMKIIGWRHIGVVGAGNQWLWLPTTIAVFTCTISSTIPGVTLAPVIATEFFADTIVMKSAITQPLKTDQNATPATQFRGDDVVIYSPADNTLAWIRIQLLGFEKVEFTFDQTTGTPTMNCLVTFM